MKRAIIAALAALIIPGGLMAQEAEEEQAEGPEVVEPESSSLEVAAPASPAPAQQKGVEQTSETYTVRPGDTLWDLSQRFLGNPWYWPKVWSYNPEIENPHWIYPGNIVRFYPPAADELPAQVGPGEELPEAPAPTEVAEVSTGDIKAPDLFGQEEDIVAISEGSRIGYVPPKRSLLRQDGLVTQRELDDAGVIDRAWAEKQMLSTFDKVYLRFRNQNAVRLGEKYSIFRTSGEVVHPATGERYGYLTHIVGSLTITGLDKEVVTGVIEGTIEDIHRGDFVGPLGNFDKQVLSKANSREVRGVILAALIPTIPMFGEHHVVFIDKGSRDGVEEGNTFTVVRKGDPLYENTKDAKGYPEEDIATIVVIDVKDTASAGLIIRSVRELVIGDTVVMRPQAAQASAQ